EEAQPPDGRRLMDWGATGQAGPAAAGLPESATRAPEMVWSDSSNEEQSRPAQVRLMMSALQAGSARARVAQALGRESDRDSLGPDPTQPTRAEVQYPYTGRHGRR